MTQLMNYKNMQEELISYPKTWIVTGAAGFIGSNLCRKLLTLDQKVLGVDNFVTGQRQNVEELTKHKNFDFYCNDVRDQEFCKNFFGSSSADFVLHQAALGSVPRSIKHPMDSHDHNVNGFLNVLWECKKHSLPLVYASSSSVYGDSDGLPKKEEGTGAVQSPYAATKAINEVYGRVFSKNYGIQTIGLRYFNVFGPHQNPEGVYAAVIPRWIELLFNGQSPTIHGDGKTTRDFCYVENAVQANILAAGNSAQIPLGEVFNIAAEQQTSLNKLLEIIKENLGRKLNRYTWPKTIYSEFRPGDIRHSLASVQFAKDRFLYNPTHNVEQGLEESIAWYIKNL